MDLFQNNTFLLLLVLWTIPWKGFALWKAAQKGHKKWFIALLVLNTAALLEAAYIFYFSDLQEKGSGKEDGKSNESPNIHQN